MKKKTNLTIKIYDNHTKNNNNNLNSPLSIKTCSSIPFSSQFIKQNNKYIDLTNKKLIYDKDYKCNLSNYKNESILIINNIKENNNLNLNNNFSSIWNPLV